MIAGAYIAFHPWLALASPGAPLFKVGHSGSLARRLTDDAYVTCFPVGWRYVATLETATKEAEKIEGVILARCRAGRVDGRELVRGLTAARLKAIGAAAAAEMKIPVVVRDDPVYAAPPAVARVVAEENPVCAFINAHVLDEPSYVDPVCAFINEHVLEDGDPERAEARPPAGVAPVLEDRDYQTEAIARCLAELRLEHRTILQMACRCGKTKVAYGVIKDYLARPARADVAANAAANILYLVPSLTLLRQTALKLAAYGADMADVLLVGSDPTDVVYQDSARGTRMTTDPGVIRDFLAARRRGAIVVCMYQSSEQVPRAGWALTIFDEAHRVCGGLRARPFNHVLLSGAGGDRLFMTATPAYDRPLSMKDRALFGGVAYRYYLREGINAGYVNDFRLELIEGADLAAQILVASGRAEKLLVFCRDKAAAEKLCAATEKIGNGEAPAPRCFVAHSGMSKAVQNDVLRQFGASSAGGARSVLFNCRLFQEGVELPSLNGVFFASPRHSPRDIIQSLCRPLNVLTGKPPSTVFLPVAALGADDVKLAAGAKKVAALGANDVKQAAGAKKVAGDVPAKLAASMADIVPIFDALIQEDPRLFEHILDPERNAYPLGAVAAEKSVLSADALVRAVRRAVRFGGSSSERLLRTEAIPWAVGFGELQRIVLECGRYPKTTDSFAVGDARINFHRYYRWCADQYAIHAGLVTAALVALRARAAGPAALILGYAGVESSANAAAALRLEPHQLAELESLPCWHPHGIEGPYPWGYSMEVLDGWLTAHGGRAPMVEINKGGYVGLESSPLEKLSGTLTCINQSDGKDRAASKGGTGFTTSEAKQRDLDWICAKHGLRWRKERDAAGTLIEGGAKTFIQEAYSRFKAYYADAKAKKNDGGFIETYFKDYPRKHARQQSLSTDKACLPVRWKIAKRRYAAASSNAAAASPDKKIHMKTTL